jgi:hypothetical protein
MSDASPGDPLWTELRGRVAAVWPRYEARFGQCLVCGLGATWVAVFHSVTWSACETCKTSWPVGENILESIDDPDVVALTIQELMAFEVLSLPTSGSDDLAPVLSTPPTFQRSTRRMPQATAPKTPPLDPNFFFARTGQSFFTSEPVEFRALLFTETLHAAVDAARAGLSLEQAQHYIWDRVRHIEFRNKRIDMWFRDGDHTNYPSFVRSIFRGRDLRLSLLAMRQQIDEALEQLEPLNAL